MVVSYAKVVNFWQSNSANYAAFVRSFHRTFRVLCVNDSLILVN